MSDPIYTVDEAADRLKISRWLLYTLMREGEIDYSTVGSRRRITESQVQDYLEKTSSYVDVAENTALQSQSPTETTGSEPS